MRSNNGLDARVKFAADEARCAARMDDAGSRFGTFAKKNTRRIIAISVGAILVAQPKGGKR